MSRTLPMGDRLKAILQEALAVKGEAPTVFTNRTGTPWSDRNLLYVFKRACKRAKIEDCSLHTLRHTFASRLVMAGVDLRTVQELMGHKDIQMTMRYAHLSGDHKRQAIAVLEQRFSGEKSHQISQQQPEGSIPANAKVVNIR